MDSIEDLRETMFSTAAHRCNAKVDPFLQDLKQSLLPRPAVATDRDDIDANVTLEARVRKQQINKFLRILILGFGSNTKRTRASLPDSSRTRSNADSSSCFS